MLYDLIQSAPKHISSRFIYKSFSKGSFILFPGDTNDYLFILIEGIAEIYRQNEDGAIISLHQAEPYSVFGEIEIFNPIYSTHSVIAKSDCQIISIHKSIVMEWMKADFDFNLYLFNQLSEKLIVSSERGASLALLTVKERIIISVYSHYQLDDLDNLTKDKLSTEVIAPLRSLNRSIAECKKDGILSFEKKHFRIIDLDLLIQLIDQIYLKI